MVTKENILMFRIIGFLTLITILIGCSPSGEKTEDNTEGLNIEVINATQLYSKCDDTLFAALYHHPGTHSLFSNPSEWTGQPISAFYQVMSTDKKETLLMKLHQLLSSEQNKSVAGELSHQISHWCEIAFVVDKFEQKMSREELLAKLYQSDRFNYLFLEFGNRSVFQEDELSNLDKVASLSSAQTSEIISTLVTDLAMSRAPNYEAEREKLEEVLQ